MDATTSNNNSDISEDKIARIRRKLLKTLEWIKSQDVNERVVSGLLNLLRYFASKSTRKEYHPLNDLILRFMETISNIKNNYIRADLKEMFDNILPELTEWCGIIAINAENAPFLQTFFLLWSEVVSGIPGNIKRYTSLNKISALINICETIFKTGHFQTQLNGLELFLRYIETCEKREKEEILKTIIPSEDFRRIRDLLCNFDNSNFEFDSRDFLNEFNMIISEEEPVYSIAVEKGYIGEKPIIKPMHGTEECVLWVDFNSATESVSFYCNSTTFLPKSTGWINIEMKCPKKINIERRTCEFHIFANIDDVEVYSLSRHQVFSQSKLTFTFIYDEKDLSHLQKVISCYNFKQKISNDASVYTETDRFYTGFKTVDTETNRDNFCVPTSTTERPASKLPPPKIQTKIKKHLQDSIPEKSPQKGLELKTFKNVINRSNEKRQHILASKSDISSAQNTSTGNKKLSTEEIVSTSDTSKVSMQKIATAENRNDKSKAGIAEYKTVTKDSKWNTETDKKIKTAKGKAKISVNDEMDNREPFQEMTNIASGSQRIYSKKPFKPQIETVVNNNANKSGKDEIEITDHDNWEIPNVASDSQKTYAKTSGELRIEQIVHGNQKINSVRANQNTNAKKSGKAKIETITHSSQKMNAKQSNKIPIETVIHEIPNGTNPENELHLSPESIAQEKTFDQTQHKDRIGSPEANAKKAVNTKRSNSREENPPQSPKSASKRKLYTPTAEVLIGSQLSKDSQLQRRKYLQERRKTENRNSLKLINLVKPLELSEKNDEVKDQTNSNVINAPIPGNEEEIQEVIEEYVNNKGYVGIKSSLKCPGIAAKFTPQQQETIQNNLKALNYIFVNSTKKFFKRESTLHIEHLDVYDVRNCIAEDPARVKKGRKRNGKAKLTIPIKKNIVPKYVGQNTMASHSYRRSKASNLGNMKKVLIIEADNTDFDKLKQDLVFNTTPKEKSETIDEAGVLKKRQSARLKKNVVESEGSVIEIDPIETTVATEVATDVLEIPIETAASPKNKSLEHLKNIQEGKNTQVKQISAENLNILSHQAVHGQNSNQFSTSEEDIIQPLVCNESMNNQLGKTIIPSPKSERCNSAMANQSMALNVSFETKNSSDNRQNTKQKDNFEKQSHKSYSTQNESKPANSTEDIRRHDKTILTEVKPGKYTSYDHNRNRNLEKSLDRSKCPSTAIDFPLQDLDTDTSAKPNWLIKKYLDSLSEGKRNGRGVSILRNEQADSLIEFDIQSCCEESYLNNFEDDNVDLDSYCSHESNDCIIMEEDNYFNYQRNVENAVQQNSTEIRNLQVDQKNESLEKRKFHDSENKQIVPYKRVRTETTTDYNGGETGGDILSNLQRKFHKFFTSAISDIRINSDSDEIKESLFQQLSIFMTSCERHNLQSFESWKQIQKLIAQIDKEKERFHLESFAAFNQFSKAQEALVELRNTCKKKDAEKLDRFKKVRSGMKETVTRIAKAEWQDYIDNLTSNIINSIQRNMDLDLQL